MQYTGLSFRDGEEDITKTCSKTRESLAAFQSPVHGRHRRSKRSYHSFLIYEFLNRSYECSSFVCVILKKL